MNNLSVAQTQDWLDEFQAKPEAAANLHSSSKGSYFDPYNYLLSQQRLYAMKDRIERYQAEQAEKEALRQAEIRKRTYTHF